MTTVLCRIAYPFASCRAEWCRRALATSAYSEPSSPSPMPLKLNRKPDTSKIRFNPDELLHPRLFVRPWDGIPSMVDGFAMLRGIERKYGKIKTFKFIRVRRFRLRSFVLALGWTQPELSCHSFYHSGRRNPFHVLFILLGGAGRPVEMLGCCFNHSSDPRPGGRTEKARRSWYLRPPPVSPTLPRRPRRHTRMDRCDGTHG